MLLNKSTWLSMGNTFFHLVITVSICFILSIVIMLFIMSIRPLEAMLSPLFTLLRTIPIIAIIVVLLLVFGNKRSPSVITGFVVLPLMYEQLLTSFKQIDKNIIDDLSMLQASKWQTLIHVFLPMSMPIIGSVLVQSLGLGLKVMVMAEYIAQPNSTIGYSIMQGVSTLNTALVFSWTLILVAFAMVGEFVIQKMKYEKQ
jgi:NitT/TauT family transport system permease protein